MTDPEKLDEIEARLRGAVFGLGSEDPYRYFARGVSAGDCIQAADAIRTLRERNAALVEGLRPFAAVAEHDIGEDEADEDRFRPISHNRAPLLTVGDLRHARHLIEGTDNG